MVIWRPLLKLVHYARQCICLDFDESWLLFIELFSALEQTHCTHTTYTHLCFDITHPHTTYTHLCFGIHTHTPHTHICALTYTPTHQIHTFVLWHTHPHHIHKYIHTHLLTCLLMHSVSRLYILQWFPQFITNMCVVASNAKGVGAVGHFFLWLWFFLPGRSWTSFVSILCIRSCGLCAKHVGRGCIWACWRSFWWEGAVRLKCVLEKFYCHSVACWTLYTFPFTWS